MEQRMDPLKWKCWTEGTGWWRVESWKSCPLISGTTCCYPLWARRKEGKKSSHVCRKCHRACRILCSILLFIYLYIYIFKINRRRSMATQQGYVRELWVDFFLKHDDSWSNHLMWPDIMCTLSADFFVGPKHPSGLIQQNKTQWHSELSPAAYFLQFSEAQPEYQIPKIMPQVSTCWFAFADWDFEERFLHNKVSTGNWAKFDKLCWKHMSVAIPVCSL